MSQEIRVEHNGKSYVLKPKTITGEVIDLITPIRNKMKAAGQFSELVDLALSDTNIFQFIDPNTGDFREGVNVEEAIAAMRSHRGFMKAMTAPTAHLTTDANGRRLMAEVMQITLDRSAFSEELSRDIDSQHYAYSEPIITETTEDVEIIGDDGNATNETKTTKTITGQTQHEVSKFWNNLPVEAMIQYVDSFCSRARI